MDIPKSASGGVERECSVVALLTGRGGSSLKAKNLIQICGKPVLAYPALAARDSRIIRAWYCSSDDKGILDAAEGYGYRKIERPEEISGPSSQHVDAIRHAIDCMHNDGCDPEIVVVLLANNVSVKTEWIDDCLNMMLADPSVSAVVPVYEDNDHHPLRAKRLLVGGFLAPFIMSQEDKVSSNRQDLEKCFFLCHNFWCIRVSAVRSGHGYPPWSFMGNRVVPYVVDKTVDIHDAYDVKMAKDWLESNQEDDKR